MTMVNSSALAIIVNSSVSVRVFPQTFSVSGSGRKAGSNGGPPEACLGYPSARTSRWDVACVGRKLSRRGAGEPLQRRAWGIQVRGRADGMWRVWGENFRGGD